MADTVWKGPTNFKTMLCRVLEDPGRKSIEYCDQLVPGPIQWGLVKKKITNNSTYLLTSANQT